MTTEVSRRQLVALIQPGDGVAVEYIRPDLAQEGIQWAERGRAAHFLCLLGGLDLVQACVTGISHGNLDDYLRGNCVLKFYRVRPYLNAAEQAQVRQGWLDQVTNVYGWQSVLHAAEAYAVKRYVTPYAPAWGRFLLRDIARAAGHDAPDCSALWAGQIQPLRPKVLPHFPPALITPERIVRHDSPYIECVRTLERPILRREDR